MPIDHSLPGVYSQWTGSSTHDESPLLMTIVTRLRRASLAACAAALFGAVGGPVTHAEAGQAPGAAQPARVEPALTLEVEGFCSETRLRTSNARVTWRAGTPVTGPGLTLATATQRLEATVFKNGFTRGMYVALPIGAAAVERPIAAIAPAAAAQQPQRRAYQIRLIQVNAARTAASGASEMDAVVENLEPGVTYTWRMALDAPAGPLVSSAVTLRAPVCPADMVEPPPVQTPRRRP